MTDEWKRRDIHLTGFISVQKFHPSVAYHYNYASPTFGEAYRDRRLTTNFKLWVEIFCVPTCFHMRIPKPCLSVCLHPEKRYHHSFVNISPTLVFDTSMKRSSRLLHHGNPKIWIFFIKVRNSSFDEELKSPQLRQYQSYISNWYINGKYFTSTTPWKPKNWIFFNKVRNLNFDFWRRAEITLASSMSPTLVIDTSMEWSSWVLYHGNPKIWFFFSKKFKICLLTKSWNHLSFVNISPTLAIDTSMEWSSPSTTPCKPENFNFFQELKICILMKSWNHLSFVNISPTLVIDTSMEWSSWVLQHGNPKIWFFKKVRNSNFDFWLRAEITLGLLISVLH